jgi:hypothetical protein
LVENIIKSNGVTMGKLFADGAYEGNEIFGYLGAMESIFVYIKVRTNARVDGKKGTSLEIYPLYLRKRICKDGRI